MELELFPAFKKPSDEEIKRFQETLRGMDHDAMNATVDKVTKQIDLAIRLEMAEKERRISHALIALLLQRLGGRTFVRQSEREEIAIKGASPDYLPEFELSESEDSPLNGVIMCYKER